MDTEEASTDVLHTEFYLTRAISVNTLYPPKVSAVQLVARPDVRACSFQQVLRLARPNLDDIFDRVSNFAKAHNVSRIAVCVCGPAGLIEDVEKHSRAYSNEGCRFDCQIPSFASMSARITQVGQIR
jgi:hypothetical protein